MEFVLNNQLNTYKNSLGEDANLHVEVYFKIGDIECDAFNFSASRVLKYHKKSDFVWIKSVYDQSSLNEEFVTTVSDISIPDVVVYGYYDTSVSNFYFDVEKTQVITPATNKVYVDKNGTGVYKWSLQYNNQFDNPDDTQCVFSINNIVFVVNRGQNDLTDKNVVDNILSNIANKENTYCVDCKENGSYNFVLKSFVQYTHWYQQSYRTINFPNGIAGVPENFLNWIKSNGSVASGILVTDRQSLEMVADTIRAQVGESGTTYKYPGTPGDSAGENTFVGKIKQLNNTYLENNDNPANESNVLSGKKYWLNGELKEGTMTNNGAASSTISNVNDVIQIPEGYHNGVGTVKIDDGEKSHVVSDNIKSGATILGVSGSNTVLETSHFKEDWPNSNIAPITAGTIIQGYGGYVDGQFRYGDIINCFNERVVPTHDADHAEVVSVVIDGNTKDSIASRIADSTHINTAYGFLGKTQFAIPFDKISKANIVTTGGVTDTLENKSNKISQDINILGVQGTMRAYGGDDEDLLIADSAIRVENSDSTIVFEVPVDKDGYFAAGAGIKTTYENFTYAYNSAYAEVNKIKRNNIKSGCTILGVSGSPNVVDTSNASNVSISSVVAGNKFYDNNGILKTGTMTDYSGKTQSLQSSKISIETASSNTYVCYTIPNVGKYAITSKLRATYNTVKNVYNDANATENKILAENIKVGSTIFGVQGIVVPSPNYPDVETVMNDSMDFLISTSGYVMVNASIDTSYQSSDTTIDQIVFYKTYMTAQHNGTTDTVYSTNSGWGNRWGRVWKIKSFGSIVENTSDETITIDDVKRWFNRNSKTQFVI